MQPNYWGDVPINKGLYYNNDQQTGQVLHGLITKKKTPNVMSIKSDSQGITDGAVMHLSTMLAQFYDAPTEVFWFVGYPDSGFRDLGISLRRFLLHLWQKQDIRIIGEKEFSALSYELSSGIDPQEYFKLNLAALASRIPNLRILLVIDLQQTSAKAHADIFSLVNHFTDWMAKKEWAGAIIITSSNSKVESDVTFKAPTNEVSNIFDSYRTQGKPTENPLFYDFDITEAARLIHPLILLGQPAQRTVLDYVIAHYPSVKDDVLSLLLKKDALWQLNGGAVRVSPRSIWNNIKQFNKNTQGAIVDTIPNGAKILAFQGTDRLIPQLSGLKEIDAMSIEATRLVDLFALAIGQRKNNISSFRDTADQLIRNIKHKDVKHNFFDGGHSRSIICYASQMLLTQGNQFGEDFFSLLEILTYAHADSLRLSSNESESSLFEASRWVTNLGFVYDQIYKGKPSVHSKNPEKIYGKAASYLLNLNPKDKREWANVRYTEAWQYKDAGEADKSTRIFLLAAKEIIEYIKPQVLTEEGFSVIAMELIIAAITISPRVILNETIEGFASKTLEDYGAALHLDQIITGITEEIVLFDSPGIINGLDSDFVVISCYFDLHIALLVAAGLRRHFNRMPKVILIPNNNKEKIPAYLDRGDAIVIGAPDTPELGSFVSSYDTELVRLYSLKLLGNFAIATNISQQYPKLHVLSAEGLIGNYEAWHIFLDNQKNQIFKPERNPMDQIILDFLINPLISAAEGRVFNEFVDAIGRRVKRKKNEAVTVLNSFTGKSEEKAKELLTNIDVDVKTVLVEMSTQEVLADTLDDVMQTLRSVDMDLQQLLAISSLAYNIATNAHRKTRSGSTNEIKLSLFVNSFRDLRSEANKLLQEYGAYAELDQKKMNSLSEKLAKALKNYKDLANNQSLS